MKVQVEKTHYDFDKYVDIGRWNSYYYQIAKTMEQNGKDVLVIGIGDAIVVDFLKKFGKMLILLILIKLLSQIL